MINLKYHALEQNLILNFVHVCKHEIFAYISWNKNEDVISYCKLFYWNRFIIAFLMTKKRMLQKYTVISRYILLLTSCINYVIKFNAVQMFPITRIFISLANHVILQTQHALSLWAMIWHPAENTSSVMIFMHAFSTPHISCDTDIRSTHAK